MDQDVENQISGESEETLISRRRLLKVATATGGAIGASLILRGKWAKPLVEVGVLPAHAQVSGEPTPAPTATPIPGLGTGDLQATLTWNLGDPACDETDWVDIDLHVVEPDGTRVYYENPTGPTAELDVDNTCGLGPENIFVPDESAAAGVYRVQVVYYSSGGASEGATVTATIDVRVFGVLHTFTRTLTTADNCVVINVADITFPAGTVQEVTGTIDLCTRGFVVTPK